MERFQVKNVFGENYFFFSLICSICQRALPVHLETGLALGYLCCGASTIGSTAAPGVCWLWKCQPLSLCVLIDWVTILSGFSSQSLCIVCQLWLAYVQCLHHWCLCNIVATGVTPGNIWCSKSLLPFSRLWHHQGRKQFFVSLTLVWAKNSAVYLARIQL